MSKKEIMLKVLNRVCRDQFEQTLNVINNHPSIKKIEALYLTLYRTSPNSSEVEALRDVLASKENLVTVIRECQNFDWTALENPNPTYEWRRMNSRVEEEFKRLRSSVENLEVVL